MKRFLPTLVFLLITVAAVSFIYKDRIFPKPAGETIAGGGGRGSWSRGDEAVSILTGTAKKADVPVYLEGIGTVRAYNSATVRAQVTGRLISVEFSEGQNVNQGDVLARIDPASYQAAYDQAVAKKAIDLATLENARADLKRLEALEKSNYTSAQQADAQRAKVAQTEALMRQDEAAIDSARTDLDRTVIRAPIAGRTGIREVDAGNLVTPGDADGVAVISQLQPISVLFTLPETSVADLIAAQASGAVPLTASAGGKVLGEGALEVIDNRIDQATGTIRLKGVFPNAGLTLWPGQFVNIRLRLKTLPDATVIPSAAVQQGATGRFVYVVQPDKTVKLTLVDVTQEDEDTAVIAKGVAPGYIVAASGFANLQDGSKVRVDGGEGEDRGGRKGVTGGAAGADAQWRPQEGGQPVSEAQAAERRDRRTQ